MEGRRPLLSTCGSSDQIEAPPAAKLEREMNSLHCGTFSILSKKAYSSRIPQAAVAQATASARCRSLQPPENLTSHPDPEAKRCFTQNKTFLYSTRRGRQGGSCEAFIRVNQTRYSSKVRFFTRRRAFLKSWQRSALRASSSISLLYCSLKLIGLKECAPILPLCRTL